MKSLKLIVKGYVQRVGYRQVVERIARESNITGYVKNLKDGNVEIIAQQEKEEVLNNFSKAIKIQKYPIDVKEVQIEHVEIEKYNIFEVVIGPFEEEFSDRMNEARWALDNINENLGAKIDKTNEKLDSFAGSTMERFDTVDTKYGKISNRLDKLDAVPGYLERMSNSLEKLVEAFLGAGKK